MVNTESNEFLASCLSLVLNDQTLVPDVAAAAALQGISAVTIARGLLDVGTVAEKLYLTDEEAADVVRVCEKMVAEPDAAPSKHSEVVGG